MPSLYHAAVRCQSVKNLRFLEDAPITAGRANPGARWWSRGTPPNAVGARGKLILCVARHGVRSHAVPVGLVGAPSRGVRKCPASPLSSYRVIAPLAHDPSAHRNTRCRERGHGGAVLFIRTVRRPRGQTLVSVPGYRV